MCEVGERTIHHVTAIAGSKCYGSIVIGFGKVFANPFKGILDVDEWVTAPVLVDCVCECLTVSCRSGDIGSDDDKALLGKDSRIPSC